MLSNIIQNSRARKVVIVCALIFLFSVYSLPFADLPERYVSPDEMANAFFIHQFAATHHLTSTAPFMAQSGINVVPRSIALIRDQYTLASFYGMPLIFGGISAAIGGWSAPFLTPAFSAVAVVCFYFLIRRWRKSPVALLSAVLFSVSPVFWYYSSHGMYHNALFVDLLIIGVLAIVRWLDKNTLRWSFLAGVAVGAALLTRTVEVLWVIPSLLVVLFLARKAYSLRTLVCFTFAIGSLLSPILILNKHFFGGVFATGYTLQESSNGILAPSQHLMMAGILKQLFPYGLDIVFLMKNIQHYSFGMFPYLALPFVLGYAKAVIQIIRKRSALFERRYFFLFSFVALWLTIYYGMWRLNEYVDVSRPILASSYLRFWIPIIAFGAYYVAEGVWIIGHTLCTRRLGVGVSATALGIILLSANAVIRDPLSGFVKTRITIRQNEQRCGAVQDLTESNAVVLSGHADKLFFPERSVSFRLNGSTIEQVDGISRVLSKSPLYIYYENDDSWGAETIKKLSSSPFRLKIVHTFSDATLYRVRP